LEGPEAGVYYRGIGEVAPGAASTVISLPGYAAALATDFTVQLTPIWDPNIIDAPASSSCYAATLVDANGKFAVRGPVGRFYWQAVGRRAPVTVEPLKSAVAVKGNGPYRWI
jgi:hypothetical protein